MLRTVNVAGTALLRPSEAVERRVYERIKAAVFDRFAPGHYRGHQSVNEVVQHIYTLYTAVLDEHLAKVDPWSFAGLLCHQYDQYAEAEKAYKTRRMNPDEEALWRGFAGHSRRGIKYLLELTCQRVDENPPAVLSMNEQLDAIQTLIVAAEELVQTYMRSDYYVTLIDDVELTLDPNEETYFFVPSDFEAKLDFRQDLSDARRYIPEPPFERNAPLHDEIVGEAFQLVLGARYKDILGALSGLIAWPNGVDPEDGVGVLGKSEAVDLLQRALLIDAVQAQRILAGFSLTARDIAAEGRLLYRPKQEYRARRRAFFEIPSPADGRPFLVYSREMATECLAMLAIEMSYGLVAPEWQAPGILESLNRLKRRSGKWFEATVADSLESVGIRTARSVKGLVFKDRRRIRLPDEVGEIDLLGYSPRDRLLVVVEAKQVIVGTEPKMFRSDLQKFVTNKDSYARRFSAKYLWVMDHLEEVRHYLEEHFQHPVEIDGIGFAMITHHPLAIADRITAFSCVNLAQFMRTYEIEGKWTLSATRSIPRERS